MLSSHSDLVPHSGGQASTNEGDEVAWVETPRHMQSVPAGQLNAKSHEIICSGGPLFRKSRKALDLGNFCDSDLCTSPQNSSTNDELFLNEQCLDRARFKCAGSACNESGHSADSVEEARFPKLQVPFQWTTPAATDDNDVLSRTKSDADAAFRNGDVHTACQFYQKCLAIDPAIVCCYTNLSACLVALDLHSTALSFARQHLKFCPNSGPAHYWKGRALLGLGLLEEARRTFLKGIEVDAIDDECEHGLVLVAQGPMQRQWPRCPRADNSQDSRPKSRPVPEVPPVTLRVAPQRTPPKAGWTEDGNLDISSGLYRLAHIANQQFDDETVADGGARTAQPHRQKIRGGVRRPKTATSASGVSRSRTAQRQSGRMRPGSAIESRRCPKFRPSDDQPALACSFGAAPGRLDLLSLAAKEPLIAYALQRTASVRVFQRPASAGSVPRPTNGARRAGSSPAGAWHDASATSPSSGARRNSGNASYALRSNRDRALDSTAVRSRTPIKSQQF